MRLTQFWTRLEEALGRDYAGSWASTFVVGDLGHRTVDQALAEGVPPKDVWAAVWQVLELPERLR